MLGEGREVTYDFPVGTHQVVLTVTDDKGLDSRMEIRVTVLGTATYEEETPGKEQPRVYPNPTKGELHVVCENIHRGVIRVFSVTGSLLLERPLSGQTGYDLDMGQHTPGMYYIRLVSAGKTVEMPFILLK